MGSNGPLPFTAALEEQSDDSLPLLHSSTMHLCCCGNLDCAFLRDTTREIETLHETLRDAGRLGSVSMLFSYCNTRHGIRRVVWPLKVQFPYTSSGANPLTGRSRAISGTKTQKQP